MAIEKILSYRADLSSDSPVRKEYIETLFATNDNKAHRIDVALYRGNSALTLPSGASVTAYLIRYADNNTVSMTGSASGNKVSVTLNRSCYAKAGAFALIIKVTYSGATSTVFYGEGSVYTTITDTIVDEENIVPSLSELLAQIDAMEAATTAANTATASANTAASNANSKASAAQTAANNANAKATAAQTAADAANAAADRWDASDSAKLGGKPPEYYHTLLNLLDNSDFTNPVNQRGVTSVTPAGRTHVIDRWFAPGSGVQYVFNGGIVTNAGYLWQKCDKAESGNVYTGAIEFDNETIILSAQFVKNTAWKLFGTGTGTNGSVQLATDADGYLYFGLATSAGVTNPVRRAALYEGSYTADTLPPYVPKGYSMELLECQRRYHVYETESARPSKPLDCCPPMSLAPGTTAMSQGTLTVDGKTLFYNSTDL